MTNMNCDVGAAREAAETASRESDRASMVFGVSAVVCPKTHLEANGTFQPRASPRLDPPAARKRVHYR